METIEELRNTINRAEDLQSVVTTMKSLAAVNIRQYERAVESLADYMRIVEFGFQIVTRAQPQLLTADSERDPEAMTACIVFGSDQGMCGPLNRIIARHTLDYLEERGVETDLRLVASVGARVTGELDAAGQAVTQSFVPPRAAAQLTAKVENVLVTIEQWRETYDIGRVALFHNRPTAGASYEPRTVQLLPLDMDWLRSLSVRPWPTRGLPMFRMDRETLFASLARQYLFVSLFQAFAESLASENASRLAAMQAAEKNIDERIERLYMRYHQQRQTMITQELLEVVAGFEVLK